MSMANLVAGDIGGTKSQLGLFAHDGDRPKPLFVRTYATLAFDGMQKMIAEFVREGAITRMPIGAVCFGVAGPVRGASAEMTNVPWRIESAAIAETLGIGVERVRLLNDLQAMAASVPVLHGSEVQVLQQGVPVAGGNIAVIAAGTGLGEAFLHPVDGRFIPLASEGGHADFAARTETDIALLRDLIRRHGRAEVEQAVSGRGLANYHRVTHEGGRCVAGIDDNLPDAPAAISAAALDKRCPSCVAALNAFVEAYGAEAGNFALRTLATGGVFVGGGIAPKVLPALTSGAFVRAFRDKAPFEPMLEAIPVSVILNDEAGLLGAAVYAANA